MRAAELVVVAALVAACKEKPSAPVDAGKGSDPIESALAPIASFAAKVDAGTFASASSAASSDAAIEDASADGAKVVRAEDDGGASPNACKVVALAPVTAFNGPAALRLVVRGESEIAELVFNESGQPRVVAPLLTALDGGAPASDALPPKSTLPACAIAGDAVYCADAYGAIRRGERIVARARSGTDLAAATIGTHVLMGYIAERVTSEGLFREAFVTMDDGAPVRLSENGSGATFVDLATRGDGAVALIIDARVAMTPAHARLLSIKNGKLEIGDDAVIFVGGSAERHNAGTIGVSKNGDPFALVPVADDAATFGMAAIRIDDPPKIDSPVVWSHYPNGLDPAPVAATRGKNAITVARVRPKAADPKSPRVLEIGTLEPTGTFRSRCIADEAAFVKDVDVAEGRDGQLWVFHRDPRGARLARIDLERHATAAEK